MAGSPGLPSLLGPPLLVSVTFPTRMILLCPDLTNTISSFSVCHQLGGAGRSFVLSPLSVKHLEFLTFPGRMEGFIPNPSPQWGKPQPLCQGLKDPALNPHSRVPVWLV